MSLIEGVGDEVTAIFAVFLLLIALALLWMSTGVSDLPPIHIVILDPRRWRQILQRIQPSSPTAADAVATNTEPAGDGSDSVVEASVSSGTNDRPSGEPQSEHVSDAVLGHSEIDVKQITTSPTPADHSTVTSQPTEDIQPLHSPPASLPSQAVGSEPITTGVRQSESTDALIEEIAEAPEGQIRVRVKYLDERQKLMFANPDTTIGDFKRSNFSEELNRNLSVRFIYQGQELHMDEFTLRRYNVSDNSVLHCLLSRAPNQISQQSVNRQQNQPEVNLGLLMLPLFGIMLGLIWYCRFAYRAYFNAISTISLAGITFLYSLALYATYRRPVSHEHAE